MAISIALNDWFISLLPAVLFTSFGVGLSENDA
jgi:hypothetical protein